MLFDFRSPAPIVAASGINFNSVIASDTEREVFIQCQAVSQAKFIWDHRKSLYPGKKVSVFVNDTKYGRER